MKFITSIAIAASSLVAFTTADMLQISNPTEGTIWTAGQMGTLSWSGDCAVMGAQGKNVTVDFVEGPKDAVRFKETYGHIDCSGATKRADIVVPNLPTGKYALIFRTNPGESYTNFFQVNNPSSVASPAPATTTTTGATSSPSPAAGKNAAGSLSANAMMAFAGAAAVASQLL